LFKSKLAIVNPSLKKEVNSKRNILRCVDPDDVQVTVVNTLLVFVGVTCASLGSLPWLYELAEITHSRLISRTAKLLRSRT